jgi:hypothetical protein
MWLQESRRRRLMYEVKCNNGNGLEAYNHFSITEPPTTASIEQ